jgi:hypothetical protein
MVCNVCSRHATILNQIFSLSLPLLLSRRLASWELIGVARPQVCVFGRGYRQGIQ